MDEKKAYKYVLRLLSKKDYSEFEIRNKMKTKDFSEEIIDDLLTKFKDNKYLDDERYCQSLVEYKINLKYLGRIRVKKDLQQKGINSEIIDKVLNDCYKPSKEEELLDSLLEKKISQAKTMDNNIKRKIISFLLRKGFSYRPIIEKLNEKLNEDDFPYDY